jgi:hypothetical protein
MIVPAGSTEHANKGFTAHRRSTAVISCSTDDLV